VHWFTTTFPLVFGAAYETSGLPERISCLFLAPFVLPDLAWHPLAIANRRGQIWQRADQTLYRLGRRRKFTCSVLKTRQRHKELSNAFLAFCDELDVVRFRVGITHSLLRDDGPSEGRWICRQTQPARVTAPAIS
jgi:hypothetical protein